MAGNAVRLDGAEVRVNNFPFSHIVIARIARKARPGDDV
jgi:hypothetical protein